jgi:anti-sigma factor RsiW
VSCLAIREQLAEHALGVLGRRERGEVERHLEWCAACRKEAGELQRAAATLAYSVAPSDPPADLGDRVAEAVRAAAGRRRAAGG